MSPHKRVVSCFRVVPFNTHQAMKKLVLCIFSLNPAASSMAFDSTFTGDATFNSQGIQYNYHQMVEP